MTVAHSPAAARDPLAWAALFFCGLAWGMTGPLSKLAVSTGHSPVGIAWWTTLIAVTVFTAIILAKGVRPPRDRRHLVFYLACGFLGTALPNSLAYEAYRHLPIGVNVMILSLIPMMTLMLALPLGLERMDARRAAGLGLGVVAVAFITLPETSLPSPEIAVFVVLPLIVATSYAAENVVLARWQPAGTGALSVMWGLSAAALILLTPLALAWGSIFDISALGPPERAVIGSAALHICAYFTFVWLVGRAGPVFAAQVGYVVTAAGVLLGLALYDERHSLWVWAALALMMAGLTLVKPRSASR